MLFKLPLPRSKGLVKQIDENLSSGSSVKMGSHTLESVFPIQLWNSLEIDFKILPFPDGHPCTFPPADTLTCFSLRKVSLDYISIYGLFQESIETQKEELNLKPDE